MQMNTEKNLALIHSRVENLEELGLLPGAAQFLAKERPEFQRPTELLIVSDANNPAADFSSETIAVSVIECDYTKFVETHGIQNSDVIIFETQGRLNRETLSQWEVAIALAKKDVFVGILDSGADALDPDNFERIAEANRADVAAVLSAQGIPYFTERNSLKMRIDAHGSERRNNRFASILVSLEKRTRAGQRHIESLGDALGDQLKFRLKYDDVIGRRGVRTDDTLSWEVLLREKILKVTQETAAAARKKIDHHFKTYNGGVVYAHLLAYLRGNRIDNPRKPEEIAALESGLLKELAVSSQTGIAQIQDEFLSDVRLKIDAALQDVIACISAEYALDDFEIEPPPAEANEMNLPSVFIDERRALISQWKRVARYCIEAISGAILGAVGVTLFFPEPTTIAIGAIVGGIAKMIYAYYDMRDTSRDALELQIERQLQGVVKDAGDDAREAWVRFSEKVFAEIQDQVEVTIGVISSELSADIEAFNRMVTASADEVRVEIDRVNNSIEELTQFLELLRSMAEEPADFESEAAAAD